MIVEHLVDGEKRIAEVCDGRWILKNSAEIIEGNFIVSACHVLAGRNFPVEKCVLVNDPVKSYERFLLVSDEPFVVVTGISQKNVDHITFSLRMPGVVEGNEVSDVPLFDCESEFVSHKVSADGFEGELTTLARTLRLAKLTSETLFADYGILNRNGANGRFVYSVKNLVGHQIFSEKFREFDYTRYPAKTVWIPADFALSVIRLSRMSKISDISVTEVVESISSSILAAKSRMK